VSERIRKVESQLKEIVSEEVASLSDPRIKSLVTITGARVSSDLKHATIYYSVLSVEDLEDAKEGLQSAAGRIQGVIGSQIRLKRTPRLRFEPDPVVENVGRIEAALRGLREAREDADTYHE